MSVFERSNLNYGKKPFVLHNVFVFSWILFNDENQTKQTTVCCRRRAPLVLPETVLVYENRRIHHSRQTQCLESLMGESPEEYGKDDDDHQW